MVSWIYEKIVKARTLLYKKQILKSTALGVPTISIGNITVGGTGKTPLVRFVAEVLAESGEKVCILTRGYGRENSKKRVLVSNGEKILADAKKAGDEPLELAEKLLGKAYIVADTNRVSAGNWARDKFGITAFVLDDAFQHFKLKRNLDIVAIDATNPFGNKKMLPSGILREPLKNLKRADIIIITRANLVKNLEELKTEIKQYNANCPIFTAKNKTSNLVELNDFLESKIQNSKSNIQNLNSIAFCGLGNPSNFFEQLKNENFQIISTEKFPDHHFYNQKDIFKVEKTAQKNGAEILLTTAKDAVKLKNLKFDLSCFVVESEMIFDDEKKLREIIRFAASPF